MVIKICTLLLALFLLSGCATLNIVTFGLSGISFITTGKSLSDHALSAVTDQDCAFHRIIFDEKMCQKTNGVIETNGEVVLAKNLIEENHLTENQVNLFNKPNEVSQIASTEKTPAKAIVDKLNIPNDTVFKVEKSELIASLEQPITVTFESNKQVNNLQQSNRQLSNQQHKNIDKQGIYNTQVLYDDNVNQVAKYKVIGSFNNKSYAITRANLYQDMGAVVIANHKGNAENHAKAYSTKTSNTKYRVVLGPYLPDTQLPEIGKIAKTEKSSDWLLSLCVKTLSPPPCVSENINLARTFTN